MEQNIIGRKKEKEILQQVIDSNESRFVAVYGRRRVGKTFLVREFLEDYIVFQCAGLANSTTKDQLKNFFQTLRRYDSSLVEHPSDWLEAFDSLIRYLEQIPRRRKVVFLDELPWMDTPTSGFISALEHFWNGWASARHDVVLIVCGSASSWMLSKLINNHGGLYGRITDEIRLQPFSLAETQVYLESRGIVLSLYELAECYMIMGGIPYYLHYLDRRHSLAQNIDRLMFNPNGPLHSEFEKLFMALFKDSENYVDVVTALSKHPYGMTRTEISHFLNLPSGKGLTTVLNNLEVCGFVLRQTNYITPMRNPVYRLIDFFSLFYVRFLSESNFRNLLSWTSLQRTPRFYSWAGLAFENLAIVHLHQIKKSMGISGVLTSAYSWRSASTLDGRGAQVDLVIDRNDNTINLCEAKFSEGNFSISKDYEMEIRNKISQFLNVSEKRKSIQVTLITTFGLERNSHSGVVQSVVTLADLCQ